MDKIRRNDKLNKSKMRLVLGFFITFTMLSINICGCSGSKSDEDTFYIYDINRECTKLVANEYTFSNDFDKESDAKSSYVGEALQRMIDGPKEQDVVGAIGTQIGSVTYRLEGNVAMVDFGEDYYKADKSFRVLRCAAIVRTLCQIDGISGVSFSVNNEAIIDSYGRMIGVLSPDSFLGNDEAKINDYEKVDVHLYFATEDGEKLTEVTRQVVYDGKAIPEKMVIESIIQGPEENEKCFPTINPATKVSNVTVKDGICYVNLSADFLTKTVTASDEVVIYSIVNSLTRMSNENKVQIMIDGETEVSFGSIYLSTPFEGNYELLN